VRRDAEFRSPAFRRKVTAAIAFRLKAALRNTKNTNTKRSDLPETAASMLKSGILNPHLNSLLARIRHTNWLVIADRGFPFWPQIETVDISLVDDVPTVLQVINAVRPNFVIGAAWMAREFLETNSDEIRKQFADALRGIDIEHERHVELKKRVPHAIGLIRTGDTTQYANIILESA
jgi:D-ribose pyranase